MKHRIAICNFRTHNGETYWATSTISHYHSLAHAAEVECSRAQTSDRLVVYVADHIQVGKKLCAEDALGGLLVPAVVDDEFSPAQRTRIDAAYANLQSAANAEKSWTFEREDSARKAYHRALAECREENAGEVAA